MRIAFQEIEPREPWIVPEEFRYHLTNQVVVSLSGQGVLTSTVYVTKVVLDQSIQDWLVFKVLADRWRAERGSTSSITKMAMSPAYQQIIGMGEAAVPLILKELQEEAGEPDHWFWALKSITRADPVPPESRGRMREMAAAWLRWGREKGYAW